MSNTIDDAMQRPSQLLAAALSLAVAAAATGARAAGAAIPTTVSTSRQAPAMTTHLATGSFDVRLAPQSLSGVAAASGLGRQSIDKHFHGALDASSTGEMLAFVSATDGSAGYVAMETVRGSLDGRRGTFVLQHGATMTRGVPAQSITVVPDSGTDALAGLAGRMFVDIAADGAHRYRFEFTLPDAAP
jgi:hypothetical protein